MSQAQEVWSVSIEIGNTHPATYLFDTEAAADAFYKKITDWYKKDTETNVVWNGKHILYNNWQAAMADETTNDYPNALGWGKGKDE